MKTYITESIFCELNLDSDSRNPLCSMEYCIYHNM